MWRAPLLHTEGLDSNMEEKHELKCSQCLLCALAANGNPLNTTAEESSGGPRHTDRLWADLRRGELMVGE